MNKNIKNVAAGILSNLESMDDIGVKEQESKTLNTQENKSITEEKIKRSFMLTQKQIEMIYELKMLNIKKDYSEIVGEAIEQHYKRCKGIQE